MGDVWDFAQIDLNAASLAGGKGAHLGELTRIAGTQVPPGFCVTTDAFARVLSTVPSIDDRLHRLTRLAPDDRAAISDLSGRVRRDLHAAAMPEELAAAIAAAVARLGAGSAYAVRSSATGEDSPTASFAGQHDTFLNVVGTPAILEHVKRCWASLFSERAVSYRLRNGVDHRHVRMAVVVQQMVVPAAAGILFTADPITCNRTVASVEAGVGLGDALVAGLVSPDIYKVRGGAIVARTVAAEQPVLTDAQVVDLVALGQRVQARFGRPQDIEWCLDDHGFRIVQSRPITTLFPVPEAGDDAPHVYVSVGHQQMMTDAMKPLGISFFQLTAKPRMYEAGGRLFVDVAERLASPATSAGLIELLGRGDPLIGDALQTILDRGDLIQVRPDAGPAPAAAGRPPAPIEADPAIVADLIEGTQASVSACRREIRTQSGAALFDFILNDIQELRRVLFDPRSMQAIMAGVQASWWLNDQLQEWLGEKNAADILAQSVPGNVTSEMGLALLDVADAIRPHPEVVAFLQTVVDDGFMDELAGLQGGQEARAAIQAYLERYGMRCVGEIDITRPRWSERPSALVPMILGNVSNFEPGAGKQRFEQGRQEASRKERELLERLRELEDGEDKALETKRMIDRVRTFSGYREYPKYGIVSRYLVYRQALLREAERLAAAGVVSERDDVFYLSFAELHEVARTHQLDDRLIDERKAAFASYQALTPPRVITSEGEVVTGAYRREDLPAGALVGLAVSAGTVEGRARVILDIAQAELETGDILVTAYTDPSWATLFVAISGLVTEVGGLMTHGAVIAREYGLPAVVGVQGATTRIRDGQRIRVHGTDGYVELLA